MIPDKIMNRWEYMYQSRPYKSWIIDDKQIIWNYVMTKDFEGNNKLDRIDVRVIQTIPHWYGNKEKTLWSDSIG